MVISPPAPENVFDRYEVEFDAGPDPVFHGGELVTGSLKIRLKQEVTINSIRLIFRGRAVWIGPNNKKEVDGQTEKVYFDKDFILLERPPGHPAPGHFPWKANFTYSLPFECPLPKGCETSYEGPFGFIRYYAKAILETDEVSVKGKYMVKKAFSIVSPPELNHLVPPQSEPISRKETVRFGGCCCRSKMTAEIRLPKSAYAPGEKITGEFSVDSRTARNAIEHIEVRLVDRLQRILEPNTSANVTVIENGKEINKKAEELKNDESGTKKTKSPKKLKKQHMDSEDNACQRVVLGRKLTKEELIEENGQMNGKKENMIKKSNVFFIEIPAVLPTTQIDINQLNLSRSMLMEENGDNGGENDQFSRLLESPSTATLRSRKEPFLKVDYALQIAIGPQVLLELPIQVHPIPIYAKNVDFRQFVQGAQQIGEAEDSELIPFGTPFTFAPFYPIYIELPKQQKIVEEQQTQPEQQPVRENKIQPNIETTVAVIKTKPNDDIEILEGPLAADGGLTEVKTITTVEIEKILPDGSSVLRKEEFVFVQEIQGSPNEAETAVAEELHQAVTEHELQRTQNEIIESSINNGDRSPSLAKASVNDSEESSKEQQIQQEGEGLGELPNGHNNENNTRVGEEKEWNKMNDGNGIRQTMEHEQYEVQNEDDSKTTVHKTTEIITSETNEERIENGHLYLNNGNCGDLQQNGHRQSHEELQTAEPAEQQQNDQMDVSMSG